MPEKIQYYYSGSKTDPHQLILEQITQAAQVLDVGCSTGYLGERLIIDKKCEVWGVEPFRESAVIALQKGYKQVFNEEIEKALENQDLAAQKFDYIIAADVLEHTVHPEGIVTKLRNFLKPNGKLIISLPNVAHYSTRFTLLCGNWDMTETGILDKTHLRFFTIKTMRALVESNGWKIISIRPSGSIERWFGKVGLGVIGYTLLRMMPGLFSFQFIIVGEPVEKR